MGFSSEEKVYMVNAIGLKQVLFSFLEKYGLQRYDLRSVCRNSSFQKSIDRAVCTSIRELTDEEVSKLYLKVPGVVFRIMYSEATWIFYLETATVNGSLCRIPRLTSMGRVVDASWSSKAADPVTYLRNQE